MSRKDKTRSMFMTSSDTSIHSAAAATASVGDRNGGVMRVAPTAARDVPASHTAAAAHTTTSQPALMQRSPAPRI